MSRTKTRECKECSEQFEAEVREINRGNGKFCSQSCANSYINRNREGSSVKVECAYCGEQFRKPKSRVENSKTGLFFCCREHKDKAQRLDSGIDEINPDHYGNGSKTYRSKALREQSSPHYCSECERTLPKPILEVHHIDGDRENNSLENLKVVCPTCHRLEHYQEGTGRWGQ